MPSKSGTCHSAGSDMKVKNVSEITMNLKKTVKSHSEVQLGAANDDDDDNVPDKTMNKDVMEDVMEPNDEDNKEDITEDSVTYSRNKKMCLCNNKSVCKKKKKMGKMILKIMVK